MNTYIRIILLGIVVVLALSACGDEADSKAGGGENAPDLKAAHEKCMAEIDNPGVAGRIKLIGSDKIEVNGAASSYDGAALACLFEELDTPKSLVEDLSVTTTSSGSDSLDAGGLHYAWSVQDTGVITTYQGLFMTITTN